MCALLEITKITKGRRIGKYDAAAWETTFYYYNDPWQILAEYTADTTCRQWFTYGNYIDETVSHRWATPGGSLRRYLLHDHLYSPVALLSDVGVILQRYEYDAYGWRLSLTSAFAPTTLDYGNDTAFTGRQLDILDSGSLQHMHYRHRDYNPQLGRFMQHDPLGINPFELSGNLFRIKRLHYLDGINLYAYARNTPLNWTDFWGLIPVIDLPGSDGSSGGGGGWRPPGRYLPVESYPGKGCFKTLQDLAFLFMLNSLDPDIREGAGLEGVSNDKFAHCYVSCRLSQECGELSSFALGTFREMIQQFWDREGSIDDVLSNVDGLICADLNPLKRCPPQNLNDLIKGCKDCCESSNGSSEGQYLP